MSMISAQIDELRQMADGQVTYRDARVVMLEAADTIWQLRDDLQRANADNAKLRELVVDMYKAFMHGACYRWCEFKEPCNYISDGKCQWYDRGHELGVEVDE